MIPQGPSVSLTEQGKTIGNVWGIFLPLAIGVFLLVLFLVLYVVIRFRRRDEVLAKQTHYRPAIEITYTVIPLIAVVALFAIGWFGLRDVSATTDDPDFVVDVIGFQWQWQFEYPEAEVTITGDDPDHPPVLVLPAESSVRFNMESRDVIHSFWVPEFHFKRDLIPGSPSSFDVDTTDETGLYDGGVCAEFCGLYHTQMRFSVRIISRVEFEQWLDDQQSEGS